MLDWLKESFSGGLDIPLERLAARLAAAFLLGALVAGVYWASRRPAEGRSSTFAPTLVLLAVLIAMVTVIIGDNTARAFSLVGALAIVRFRTVVEDTRDTAFVIFAVVVGMAAGAGYLIVALVGVPLVVVAALLFRPRRRPRRASAEESAEATLVVRVGVGHSPEAALDGVCRRHLGACRLVSAATARQGAALDLTYAVRLRPGAQAVALVAELNQVEGVQAVELRQP
jgi:uncharacterized membrane protein YhiD involved in acid resistance